MDRDEAYMIHEATAGGAPHPDRRLRECVERWPEATTGEYDPRCCRFPKSCSADVHHAAATDPDLERLDAPAEGA